MTCAPSHTILEKKPVGRPRTTSLPPDQMIALGEEMIKWLNEHPGTLHISQWYIGIKHILRNDWKLLIKCEEFYPYYEHALQIIGIKYLDKTSVIRDNIAPRWQRIYFGDLREQEDADLDADAKRSKEINTIVTADTVLQHAKLMSEIADAQASFSARKIDNNKSKADAKS